MGDGHYTMRSKVLATKIVLRTVDVSILHGTYPSSSKILDIQPTGFNLEMRSVRVLADVSACISST